MNLDLHLKCIWYILDHFGGQIGKYSNLLHLYLNVFLIILDHIGGQIGMNLDLYFS